MVWCLMLLKFVFSFFFYCNDIYVSYLCNSITGSLKYRCSVTAVTSGYITVIWCIVDFIVCMYNELVCRTTFLIVITFISCLCNSVLLMFSVWYTVTLSLLLPTCHCCYQWSCCCCLWIVLSGCIMIWFANYISCK